MRQSKNQYQAREEELQKILNLKLAEVKQTHDRSYTYANEVKQGQIEPIIYSKLRPKKATTMNKGYVQLFFNEAIDRRYFMYNLVPLIAEAKHPKKKKVPTPRYCQEKHITEDIDQEYTPVIQKGYLTAKKYSGGGNDRKSTLNWNYYFYTLRRFTYFFYTNEVQDAQVFEIEITQRSMEKNLENIESFAIEEDFYVKKDQRSGEFRRMVEEIVFFRAYQMVYAIDNLAPTTSVTGYENGGLDLEMDFRRTTKNIYRKTKEYKESMSSFLTHLMAKVQKRMTRTLSLYVPQTLNYVVPALPTKGVVEILKTNLVPSRSPLLQLHLVNLDNTLFQEFSNRLRDIFPKLEVHAKRSLSVTRSDITDQQMERIVEKLSWPLDSIVVTHNKMTSVGVIALIEASKRLDLITIDWSYNEPASRIVSDAYVKYLESSPSVKSVRLRGCILESGVSEWFFEALRGSLWINEVEMDYHSEYSKWLIGLKDFQAIMVD